MGFLAKLMRLHSDHLARRIRHVTSVRKRKEHSCGTMAIENGLLRYYWNTAVLNQLEHYLTLPR